MDRYKDKLFSDLKTDYERYEFFNCGRAWETGIVAKAIEKDVANAFLRSHEANVLTLVVGSCAKTQTPDESESIRPIMGAVKLVDLLKLR